MLERKQQLFSISIIHMPIFHYSIRCLFYVENMGPGKLELPVLTPVAQSLRCVEEENDVHRQAFEGIPTHRCNNTKPFRLKRLENLLKLDESQDV